MEMRRSSREVSDSVQKQSGEFFWYNREQVLQEQLQRVKQNQNPSPESSEEDRDSTVTACTGSEAIRNQEHDRQR